MIMMLTSSGADRRHCTFHRLRGLRNAVAPVIVSELNLLAVRVLSSIMLPSNTCRSRRFRLTVKSIATVAFLLMGVRAEGSCGDYLVPMDSGNLGKVRSIGFEHAGIPSAPLHAPCSGPNCKSNRHKTPAAPLTVNISFPKQCAELREFFSLATPAVAKASPAPFIDCDSIVGSPPVPPPRPIAH
jgi:hypothetical protein